MSKICDICKMPYSGWGNNAEPLVISGRCCDDCNMKYVLPSRLGQAVKLPDVMTARSGKLDIQHAALIIREILNKGFKTQFELFWNKGILKVKVNSPQDSPTRRARGTPANEPDILEWDFGIPDTLDDEFMRRVITEVSQNICRYHVPEVA